MEPMRMGLEEGPSPRESVRLTRQVPGRKEVGMSREEDPDGDCRTALVVNDPPEVRKISVIGTTRPGHAQEN
jgi:hypothetical protein